MKKSIKKAVTTLAIIAKKAINQPILIPLVNNITISIAKYIKIIPVSGSKNASLPIIASDWKYNNEFVTNGDNGFLCNPFNANEYIEAIKVLLLNKTLRKSMAEQSYIRSEEFSASNARMLLHEYMNVN